MGGTEIQVSRGFWRIATNTTKLYTCLDDNACLGGLQSECAEPYKGKFCSECKGRTESGKIYGRSSGYKCAECRPLYEQMLLILAVHFVKALIIFYVMYNLL
jgi:hypothetical protein